MRSVWHKLEEAMKSRRSKCKICGVPHFGYEPHQWPTETSKSRGQSEERKDVSEVSLPVKAVKNEAAAAMGRQGGRVRAAKMSAEERSEAARRAAESRWGKKQ